MAEGFGQRFLISLFTKLGFALCYLVSVDDLSLTNMVVLRSLA